MNDNKNPVYRFGGFELQPQERRLLRGSEVITLTPKAFDTLTLLVERAGHVVGKEDLLDALWPGRFVLESNLTKHISMLRKALEGSEEGGRFIETVPKLGYRFVAGVICEQTDGQTIFAAPPADSRSQAAASRIPDRRTALLVALAVFAALIVVAFAAWFWNGGEPVFPWSKRAPGTAVAVFDFDNLTRDGKLGWIGPAFSEMLGTQMAQGGQLYLLPAELVRQISGRAPQPDAGVFSPQTLADLRRQLAVDYVVTGSYFASNRPEQPVRFDIAIQDARKGMTVLALNRTGTLQDLPSLVAKVGDDLRRTLHVNPQTRTQQKLIANAEPPSIDVMRRIGFALDALHRYDSARAKDELLQAVADSPDYAPSYTYLAKAWSALGYDQKAIAAAKQAAALASGLPETMRLAIEAQSYKVQSQWAKAIATLQKLAAVAPNDPEPQFELVDVFLASGQAGEAQNVLVQLRDRGEPQASDPRLELGEARIASARDDDKAQADHARRAIQLAQARGAAGLEVDAQLILGGALIVSDPKAAGALLNQALAGYNHFGNPRGAAAAHRQLGILLSNTQPKPAIEEFRQSLVQAQSVGDRNGMAAAYADLATMIWDTGDRDGSEAATENVLRIRRETGDVAGQAWALAALAIEQSDERASDEIISALREAAALDASIGSHAHRAFSLYSLADILRLRGQFVQAQVACADALAEYSRAKISPADADLECAEISLDRGDLPTVETTLRRVREEATHTDHARMLSGNVDIIEGQIAIGEKRWLDAARLMQSAYSNYLAADVRTGEAVASSLLALCYSSLGKDTERSAALRRAAELRTAMTERQEIIQVDIARSELQGESSNSASQAVTELESFAADARARQWPGWALEAELAELHVLEKAGQMALAASLRARIAETARSQGFGWVLRRVT
ncbi:MAG TPA: winged helix-turn-helix domain-containing protein [Rhizomicrobium sp.]|nr:winged helix-turn-helix domain-containing protein [Rhizomicrobium sp.]